MTVALVIVNV